MFDKLTLRELRVLLRELKDHHDIKQSSKMKKAQLVAALSERFVLEDGNLYLKADTRPAKDAEPRGPRRSRLGANGSSKVPAKSRLLEGPALKQKKERPAAPAAPNTFAQDMQKLVDFLEIIGVPFDKNNKLHRYGLQTMKSNLDRVVKRGDVEGVEDWLQSLNDPFDYTKRLFP
jgi:hypothetical protein